MDALRNLKLRPRGYTMEATMATLVRIGDTLINLDQVTQIFFKPGSVRLYFAVVTGKGDDRHLDYAELFGADATAIKMYLQQASDDAFQLLEPED